MTIYFDFFLAKSFSIGNYSIAVTTPSPFFTFKSQGKYKVTLVDVYGKCVVKGKLENINGEDYMKLYKFDIDPEASDLLINLSDPIFSRLFKNKIQILLI